jgi:Glycosyl transferase family 2
MNETSMTTNIPATEVALVLETNNLASRSDEATVTAMARLLEHLRAQSLPLADLRELVVTHDGIGEDGQAQLRAAARRELTFVRLPADTGYYEAKNLGFAATTAPIVAFGDADCWPDREWLQHLVEPLGRGWKVSAGRTTYREGRLGRALSSIDFMYFHEEAGATTRNFYANNVAFVRTVLEEHRYQEAPMYRGACQLLGMRLRAAGIAIRYVDAAHTVHRLPDAWQELVELRLRRGRDLRQLSPHVLEAALPGLMQGQPASARRGLALGVLAGRWVCSLGYLRRGARSRRRRASEAVLMTGIAGLDALGALGRAGRGRDGALSYHEDVDRLVTAVA